MTDVMSCYYPDRPLPGPRMIIDTTEIHLPYSREIVGVVEEILDDCTICLIWGEGKRSCGGTDGNPKAGCKAFLEDLFQEIEDDHGDAYIVVQILDDRKMVAWVPDSDGRLRRLRALMLDAEVLDPEV